MADSRLRLFPQNLWPALEQLEVLGDGGGEGAQMAVLQGPAAGVRVARSVIERIVEYPVSPWQVVSP